MTGITSITHHEEVRRWTGGPLDFCDLFGTGNVLSDSRAVFPPSDVNFDFTCPFLLVLAAASGLSLNWLSRWVPHRIHLARSVGFIRAHRSQCHCRTEAIEPILLESWLFYHEISFGLQINRASWSTILMHFVAEFVM